MLTTDQINNGLKQLEAKWAGKVVDGQRVTSIYMKYHSDGTGCIVYEFAAAGKDSSLAFLQTVRMGDRRNSEVSFDTEEELKRQLEIS